MAMSCLCHGSGVFIENAVFPAASQVGAGQARGPRRIFLILLEKRSSFPEGDLADSESAGASPHSPGFAR
jgi:hypothetical protein